MRFPKRSGAVRSMSPRSGPWRRLRVLAALLAAVAIAMLATGGEAFAVTWTGPNGSYGTGSATYSLGPVSQAFQGSVGLAVWHSATNNEIYFSYNGGTPFLVGNATTYVAPTAVAWGNNNFAVFSVGTNQNVYWTFTTNGNPGNPASWSQWVQVNAAGNPQTSDPVGVTQLGQGSNGLYLVWRGANANTTIYGSYFNGDYWATVESIGGSTDDAPSITFNSVSQALWVTVRGGGGGTWLNSQNLGNASWNGWYEVGGGPVDGSAPAIQAQGAIQEVNGTQEQCMTLGETDSNGTFNYTEVTPYGTTSNWVRDPSGWVTNYNVNLSSPQAGPWAGTTFGLINGINLNDAVGVVEGNNQGYCTT
jgi:hypothetical protein